MVQNIDLKKLKVQNFEEKYSKDIIEIYLESYKDIYGCKDPKDVIRVEKNIYGPNYPYLSPENLIEYAKRSLNILVCTYNDKVVAFTSFLFWDKKTVYIDEFHVKKEFRGLGIGSWFLKKLEEILRSRGVRKIVLDAYTKSVGFFLKQGYISFGKRYQQYYIRISKFLF